MSAEELYDYMVCDKALDRCKKKEKFFNHFKKCLKFRVCPQCGDDLDKHKDEYGRATFKCVNQKCNFKIS